MSAGPLESIELESGPDPTASVIWMHGLGADGYDFVPVANELDLPPSLPVRFVFPHAPHRPVTINHGMIMRAWYDVYPAGDVRREDEDGLRASQAAIEALVARERARGIAPGRLVLAGFSQGGAVALQAGLRHPERLAGLLVLSSYLPLARAVEAEATPAGRTAPIFMAHGTGDPVIPVERAVRSRDVLAKLGCRVEWHEYPMPHAVCDPEIRDIAAWLIRTLEGD